jgi:hypothetical protein
MRAFLRAGAFAVADVLSDRYAFTIPAYQRPYAWTAEQVEQLLDDALEAMDRARSQPDQGYFLGSIVLHKQEDDPASEVVDGQQRLISLTIIFAVMRDLYQSLPGAGSAVAAKTGRQRVLPRPRDRDFFLRFVQADRATTRHPDGWQADAAMSPSITAETAAAPEEDEEDEFVTQGDIAGDVLESDELENGEDDPETDADDGTDDSADAAESPIGDSLRNFIRNRDAVRDRLRPLAEARAAALCSFLLDRCFLVVVEVPRGDQAHRVFSVLHTRGLDLSDTDVLKAEVLGGFNDEAEQLKHQAIWERWEDQLGRDDFERLFSHLRMISRKAKQQLSVAEELRKSYPVAKDPAGFLVKTLGPMAEALHQIRSCQFSHPQAEPATVANINRSLKYLSWVTNDAWVPPAMAYLVRHAATPDRVAQFLRVLERLAYALMILKKNDNERIARYGAVLRAIEQGREFSRIGSPLTLLQQDRAFILRRLAGSRFGDENWCLPVMKRLDAVYVPLSQPLPAYDAAGLAKANVEHVLPKNIPQQSGWLKQFKTRTIRVGYVHRIGNLIVLSKQDNDAVRNTDFEEKRKVYFAPDNTSPFGLKQAIQHETRWTPKVIERRSRAMIGRLARVWGLQAGGKARRRQ